MSAVQSFEQQVNEIKVPEIDVHDQVMYAISTREHRSNPIQSKWLIAAVISLVLVVGTGFASVKIINLYNDKGEQWVSILPFNEEQEKPAISTDGTSDYYLTLIEEGEAIAVYNPNNNDDRVVAVRTKPVQYKQWDRLIMDVSDSFPLPASLNDQFIFQFATISHAAVEPNTESLIEESRANGDKVTYEKLELLDDVQSLTLVLMVGGYDYTVSMFEGQSWETVYTDQIHNGGSQQLKISGIDGYLTSNEHRTNVMWRSSEEMGDVFYDVSTNNTSPHAAEEITSLLSQMVAVY